MRNSGPSPISVLKRLLRRLRLRRRHLNREMAEEFALHVELRAADLERGGLSPARALRQARLEFGSAERYTEEGRASRGLRQVDEVRGDIRYAVRSLSRAPVFAVAAVLTLALGVGANAAVFSLISATLLRPVPFPDADRLAVIYQTSHSDGRAPSPMRWSYPEFAAVRSAMSGTLEMATWYADDVNLSGGGAAPLRVRTEMVSAAYHGMLGVRAVAGRVFHEADETETNPVVLLGESVWRRAFGSDVSVLGRTVSLNGVALTVVGIMPTDFRGLSGNADVWIPQAMAPAVSYAEQLTSPQRFLSVLGRLADGVTVEGARAELESAGGRASAAARAAAGGAAQHVGVSLVPLETARRDADGARAQFVLAGAALFVLLIAVVNLAGLLLARTTARAREQAVRTALGAGRFRMLRQGVVEGLVIGVCGAIAGVLLAVWSVRTVVALAPERMGGARPRFADLAAFAEPVVDWRVVAFAAVVALLAGGVSGLVPVLRGTGSAALLALRQGRGSGPRLGSLRRPAALSTAAVVQIAGALVLLVGAGTLLSGFARLRAVDPGFEPAGVLTFRITGPSSVYGGDAAAPLLRQVLESVEALPGVQYATVSLCPPYTGCSTTPLYREGEPARDDAPIVGRHYVGPDHFRTLGVALVRGRALDDRDRAGQPRVAVINETAARQLWPGEDPVGKRVWFGSGGGFASPDSLTEVVGVVRDVLYAAPGSSVRADFYTSYLQFTWPYTTVMIRASVDPMSLVPAVRQAVSAVDPQLPIHDVQTMEERSAGALAAERFATLAVLVFAVLGTLLAVLGVYGIIAYAVAQQRRDIGIRMALGATAADVLRHVIARGGSLAAAGLFIGAIIAALSARALPSLMPAAGPVEPQVFAAAAVLLFGAALVACWIPARSAARINPMETIGHD